MEATMQIEVPQITVDVPTVSNVPTGSAANYTLRLTNASEIDEDVYYKLLMIDESNPDGAKITIDGMPLTDNRIIKIPAGQTVTKAMQLWQTTPACSTTRTSASCSPHSRSTTRQAHGTR